MLLRVDLDCVHPTCLGYITVDQIFIIKIKLFYKIKDYVHYAAFVSQLCWSVNYEEEKNNRLMKYSCMSFTLISHAMFLKLSLKSVYKFLKKEK